MNVRISRSAVLLFLAGCSVPFTGGDGDEKSRCDQLAAQAIQTESPARARDLAAQATECYARLAQ